MRAGIPRPLRERIRRPLRERFHGLAERRHLRGHPRRTPVRTVPTVGAVPRPSDIAVQRVRDAGGPLDQASYNCQCGYLFVAPVSTTVRCPHCDAPQTW